MKNITDKGAYGLKLHSLVKTDSWGTILPSHAPSSRTLFQWLQRQCSAREAEAQGNQQKTGPSAPDTLCPPANNVTEINYTMLKYHQNCKPWDIKVKIYLGGFIVYLYNFLYRICKCKFIGRFSKRTFCTTCIKNAEYAVGMLLSH